MWWSIGVCFVAIFILLLMTYLCTKVLCHLRTDMDNLNACENIIIDKIDDFTNALSDEENLDFPIDNETAV